MKKKAFALLLSLGLIFSFTTLTAFAGQKNITQTPCESRYEFSNTAALFRSEGPVDNMLPDSEQRIEKSAAIANMSTPASIEIHHSLINILLLVFPSFAVLLVLFLFGVKKF